MRAIEAVSNRQKRWAELIRKHGRSGLSVSAFCREHGISDQSFYNWRKRFSGSEQVRFALVDTGEQVAKGRLPVELILASGDRLGIASGVDAATLRTVLSVLRERA
jgi:transposase